MARLPHKYLPAALLGLVALVGLSTSLYRLGAKGLWGDEVWEAMWSRQQDLVGTFLRFRTPPDHPLHYVLTHISTYFSDSEFFVRLPSALLAAGTVVTLFVLGKRIFGTGVGLLAALLLAVAPYHVWYAQEARPYAALSFYSLLSLLFFWSLLERVTLWRAIGFAVATCLNLYNHLFGLLPLFTEGVLAATWAVTQAFTSRGLEPGIARAGRRRIWGTLVALGMGTLAAIALCFPLFPGVADFLVHGAPNWSDQIAPARFDLTPSFFVDLLSLFGAGAGWPFLLLFVLFAIGIGAALRSKQWFAVVALAWIALPPIVLWLAQPSHIFIPRYVLFIQPIYLLLVAYGSITVVRALAPVTFKRARFSTLVQARWLTTVSVILSIALCALLFVPTVRGYSVEKVNDWSAVCDYLWKNTQPGDDVVADLYGYGTLTWCFDVKRGAPYIPIEPAGSFDLQDAVTQGRGVWYINIASSAPDLEYVRREFQLIPRNAWAKSELIPLSASDAGLYPEGEGPATIYRYSAVTLPSSINFHEMRNSAAGSTWPDYIEIPAGRSYTVRLTFPNTGPRRIRLLTLMAAGRPVEVYVDDTLVGTISGTTNEPKWEDTALPLPADVGDAFTVRLANPGSLTSAVSRLTVETSSQP